MKYLYNKYLYYIISTGVNVVARQIATKATPVVDIDQTGDQFVVRTVSGPFTPDEVFTVGQHNVLQQPDGSKIKVGFYKKKRIITEPLPTYARSSSS